MRTVPVEQARAGLGDLIDRARLADDPTLITRYGRPVAVVVGAEWYEAARAALAAAGANNVPSGGSDDR